MRKVSFTATGILFISQQGAVAQNPTTSVSSTLTMQRAHYIIGLLLLCAQWAWAQQHLQIVVDQNGTADYTSIQQAVYSVRDHYEAPVKIFIKNGIYREKVVIPAWKRHIHLVGESADSTVIVFDDYSGKERSDAFRSLERVNTYNSYTLLVQANDVLLKNLTIENAAGSVGQAVALHLEGDRIQVRDCRILGWQDTFYLSKDGTRNYVENCYISGSTDFIFGAATALFKDCVIVSKGNSYVTAASTTRESAYGFVFDSCRLIANDPSVDRVYLGRPWRPYAKTYFIGCALGPHIVPDGWDAWKGDNMFPDKTKTVDYREYGNYGAGAATARERVPWVKVSAKRTKKFTAGRMFNDWRP